ncbi:AMP-binding protein [Streptantibioticus silvisoli]|uniref:AMP-binding protein n=1 Tax=Streptantibioticus silvisoli TaxID=2705255 RepID=A0ABT6WA07_9ACTN|nr:AMP-binding protein [Streptantibioticus silvisoli]MDI5967330.1 AMP-binding protein [Streptantibioticus silvisoli]
MAEGLVYPHGTVDAMLADSAASHPRREAVRAGQRVLDYATLDALATACAGGLRRIVERTGAVVALTSLLSPDFVIGYYGILRSGNVTAPVNPYLQPEQLAHVLSESGTEVALVDARTAAKIATVRDRLPRLREVILIGGSDGSGVPGGSGVSGGGASGGVSGASERTFASLLDGPAGGLPARGRVCPGDLAVLHFTSGTTGAPKTVMLSHRNVTANAVQVAAAHRLGGGSVVVNHLPTYHPMHMNSAIAAGAAQILVTGPDAAESVRTANRYGASHYYSLPVRLTALADSPQLGGLRFETVRMIASGGSALAPAAARKLAEHFQIPVVQGYGLAETSPLTHSDDPADWRPGSVGRPVADTEARVVDVDDGRVLEPGSIGEVQVRGPQVMLGYLGESAGSCVDEEGWLSTGDVGQIGATGRLTLVDRIKDVFKRDNWLVSPTSVERSLARHPAVRDCVVVDHPEPLHGAVATAFVVRAEQDTTAVAAIAAEVNESMPYYQHIEHIEIVESIPRSANGKVARTELRARMARILRAAPLGRSGGPSDIVQGSSHIVGGCSDIVSGGNAVITFITRFTLRGDDGTEFERLFAEHCAFMAARPGFVDFRMVRSASNPKVYVNIGRWTDPGAHKAVVSSEEFLSHVKAMGPLVEVEADLYFPVASSES